MINVTKGIIKDEEKNCTDYENYALEPNCGIIYHEAK